MGNSIKTKNDFIQSLINRNFFWSYSIPDRSNFSDDLIIEQVLCYGEPDDIINLKKYFKFKQIKQVWQICLLPDSRFKNSNVWLAKVFFNIQQANKYIAKYSKLNNRDGHLRLLAAQN
jgi:hypothetical protein